jgi:hypothetical protein
MSQSITSIANRALQLVGASAILNLTDNSSEAREVSRAYDACRRDELRARRWNFAIQRALLAADTAPPTFGGPYRYALPADCLRVLIDQDTPTKWRIEGRGITTDWPGPLPVRYIADVTDTTAFDPSFCEALAARIAVAIVERLTQSNQKKQQLKEDYARAIAEAGAVNAYEKLPAEAPDSAWLQARQPSSRAFPDYA